jgi:uncharacterized protein (DUF58 family)
MPVSIDRRQLQTFGRLELLAKQAVEGFITGLHKSPYHGFSVEFAEHRLYNTGESTRHIDWKLYARTEKLFVKRYEEETNLRCQILIDSSSSMRFPAGITADGPDLNKLKFSVYAAASLIELLKRQRDAVGLSIFSNEINVHTLCKSSPAHHRYLFNELELLLDTVADTSRKSSFVVDTLHEVAEKVHKRSLVIIFSDMMDNSTHADELFAALQHLRHNKHEVILFHVVDKNKELEFDYDNRPYTFTDLESGEEVKVNPMDVRDHYLKGINDFRTELKLRSGQNRIDFVESDIHEGFNQVLLQYLIKRQKML